MATYQDARANEFTAAATQSLTGIDLDLPKNSPLVVEPGYRPIRYCVCVTEPCDCEGPIIWINPDDIHSQEDTDRTNRAGDHVVEFRIDPDATVLVESVVRAKASALSPHGRRLRLNPSSHLPTRGGCGCGHGSTESNRAPGSHYDGQECAGHTLYDVWEESDGLDTTFYYIAVGSC
jgi:hypothetical protein